MTKFSDLKVGESFQTKMSDGGSSPTYVKTCDSMVDNAVQIIGPYQGLFFSVAPNTTIQKVELCTV